MDGLDSTNNETSNQPPSETIQNALQELIKSGRVQASTCRPDFTDACNELLSFHFFTKEGQLHVINTLAQLNGNFVAKSIRKGLTGLSKVYTDCKTFEDESIKLVDLCLLLYQRAGKNEESCQPVIPSPALVVNFAVKLSDELTKCSSSEASTPVSDPDIKLSECLDELLHLHQIILNKEVLLDTDWNTPRAPSLLSLFETTFDSLKPRINDAHFLELLQQTAVVAKRDEEINPHHNPSGSFGQKFKVLKYWNDFLKYPFISNWFAIQTAKCDIVLNILRDSAMSEGGFQDFCTNGSEEKLQIIFQHHIVFLCHSKLCLKLFQLNIPLTCLEALFDILSTDADSFTASLESDMTIYKSIMTLINQTYIYYKISQTMNERKSHLIRPHQSLIFQIAAKELLIGNINYTSIEKILRFWKKRFPEKEASYVVLVKILLASIFDPQIRRKKTIRILQDSTMEPFNCDTFLSNLVLFLSQLSTEILCSNTDWLSLVFALKNAFPESWNCEESLRFIEFCSNLEANGFGEIKQILIEICLRYLRSVNPAHKVKTSMLNIMIDLFQELNQDLREYQLHLDILRSIAPYMDTASTKKYLTDFLIAVRPHCDISGQGMLLLDPSTRNLFNLNLNQMLQFICVSCPVESDKAEVFQSLLKIIQNAEDKDGLIKILGLCMQFVSLTMSTANIKQFFIRVANSSNLKSCYLVMLCYEAWYRGDRGCKNDGLVNVLFSAIDGCLHSRKTFDLFSRVIVKYLQVMSDTCNVEMCQMLVVVIAGSISVGTFDEMENDFAIPYICHYLLLNSSEFADTTNSVFPLYIAVIRAFRQINKSYHNNTTVLRSFRRSLEHILELPLTLTGTVVLINGICKMLQRGNIKGEEEMVHIMFHLFKVSVNKPSMPSRSVTALYPSELLDRLFVHPVPQNPPEEPNPILKIDAKALSEHYVHVMEMSVNQIQKLAKLSISTSSSINTTILYLLVEKTPIAFTQRDSSRLFKLMIDKLDANRMYLPGIVLQLMDSTIKKDVSVQEFEDGLGKVQEILNITNPSLISLIVSCVSECSNVGLENEERIRSLILILNDWKWSKDDLEVVTGNRILGLNIPRQLVLTYKTTSCPEEMRRRIKMLLDVANHIEETEFDEPSDVIVEHDFGLFLVDPNLNTRDFCTALLVTAHSSESYYNHFLKTDMNGHSKVSNETDLYTPGELALLVLDELKRLHVDEHNLRQVTLETCQNLLKKTREHESCKCNESAHKNKHDKNLEDTKNYVAIFRAILKASDFLDDVRHWLTISSAHVVHCKEVIIAACGWKKGTKSCQEALEMCYKILETLDAMCSNENYSCYEDRKRQIEVMSEIIKSTEDKEHVFELFLRLRNNIHNNTVYCIYAVAGWTDLTERMAFLSQINLEDNMTLVNWRDINILPLIAKACPNSCEKLLACLNKIIGRQESYFITFARIPKWFENMTKEMSRPIIESWCTSLILYENLSSRDVDAIVNLTPDKLRLIRKEPEDIEECLFKEPAPKTWTDDHSDPASMKDSIASFKRCLQFAKILDEFASIALLLKENSQIMVRIQDGTHDLCRYFLENRRSSGHLFKIRHNVLKELFCILFSGEDVTSEHLITHSKLCTSLVTVFRRLSRSISIRPVLFGHVKTIVHQTLQKQGHSKDSQELLNAIHKHVLELEPNQDAIHFLQASGYNQGAREEDLWYSTSIQLPSYAPSVGSIQKVRTQRLLKQMMREWRGILMELEIAEVEVNGQKIKTTELMNHSDSLETMESQLHAIKNATQNAPPNDWSSVRRQQLIQKEKYVRSNIKEDANQNVVSKLAKMVIFWDNRLLDTVKTCTENIPGCYAPNGFHSEKPVICGLAVDNRILTLYKEEKVNTLNELEDVEVKLYPVGMLVYGVHSRSHCYDTDQLWAAFFKMLLLKRLVPKIFLTNVSPGFEWMKKFVKPEVSRPEGVTFVCCNTLIPSREDSFDYEPNMEINRLTSGMSDNVMDELIILTPDKVQDVEFTTLKSPKRDQLIRKVMENVPQLVKEHSRLLENHPSPEIREQLIKRLTFAIRKAAELSVDTAIPETEMISNFINLKKLSSGCKDCAIIEENREDFYSEIILDVLRAEIDENTEYNRDYDCCEHVEFLQSTECTLTRDE